MSDGRSYSTSLNEGKRFWLTYRLSILAPRFKGAPQPRRAFFERAMPSQSGSAAHLLAFPHTLAPPIEHRSVIQSSGRVETLWVDWREHGVWTLCDTSNRQLVMQQKSRSPYEKIARIVLNMRFKHARCSVRVGNTFSIRRWVS